MRSSEMLSGEPLLKMAYGQKKAESVVTGLEKPINDHLLKLWTIPEAEHRHHCLNEVTDWFDEVGEIVLKPNNRRPTADFYYRILFDEPFGGAEVTNLMSRLGRLRRHGYLLTTTVTPDELVDRLRRFHAAFAEACAAAPVPEDLLHRLIGA